MLSECEQRGTLGRHGARNAGRGCPAMEAALGRYDLVDEEKHTGRVTVSITRPATVSGQAWTRAGRGRRSCNLESPGATYRSPA